MGYKTIDYKGYQIECNTVPKEQFNFGGFGFAFQVLQQGSRLFSLVVKVGHQSEDDVHKIHTWGERKVFALIDAQAYKEKSRYCFFWDDIYVEPEEINCSQFS